MFPRFVFLLIFSFLTLRLQATSCNASQMNFISTFSLGKQDEFNRTFTQLQQHITTIPEINYSAPNKFNYTLWDIRPRFYYRDSKQRVDFKAGNILIVSGGSLEIQLLFQWNKQGTSRVSGTGSASGLSDQLILAKSVVIADNTSYSYELLSLMPLTMLPNPFVLTRIDPPLPSEDQEIILGMLNSMTKSKDAKSELQDSINKNYSYFINNSLHDKHFPIDNQFEYHWTSPQKQNVTITLVRRPTSVDLEQFGFISSFDVQTPDWPQWSCGSRKVLEMPLDPNLFGGIQQYVSFDFYQNILQWALSHGVFDSDLNQQNWGHRMFQFYVGDLYEVLSNLQHQYYASQTVKGKCTGNQAAGVQVSKYNTQSFKVELKFDCELSVRNETLVKMGISLSLVIAGKPKTDSLDFELLTHQQTINFIPQGQYQLLNRELAELMVGDCLNRLYESHLFGFGWPQSPPRDFPHFRVMDNFTAVFDSSHINQSIRAEPHFQQS